MGIDVNSRSRNNFTPLIIAVQQGKYGLAKYLIKKGADVNLGNIDGITPIMYAVYNGDLDIVRLLLKNGANLDLVDNDGWSALMWLCEEKFELPKEYRFEIKYLKCKEME